MHCPGNNDTNVIANFEQKMEILRKTDEAVVTSQPLSGDVTESGFARLVAAD